MADVVVPLVLLVWATTLTWGWGGRQAGVLTALALTVLLATAVVRPWTKLSLPVVCTAQLLGLGSFTVALTAPTGWAGAPVAASYAVAGQVLLLVAAWAQDRARRVVVLGAIAGAGGAQFAKGWLAYWGGGSDASHVFQGTFYWHNQVGIFLAAGALAAAALVVHDLRPFAVLGWCVAPLAGTGVVLTSSRGSQMGLALGVLLLTGACSRSADRLRALTKLGGLLALSGATSYLLTGPPFFDSRESVTAATAARGGTLEGSGVQRFEDWRRAMEIFKEWPVTGAGYHSFGSAAERVTDLRDGVITAFAHNGFLQALSDGGLVLALPVWAGVVVLLLAWVRGLPRALREGDHLHTTAGSVFLVLVLHSGMDFDWDYPSLMVLAVVTGALLVPVHATVRPRATWLPYVFAALSVGLLVLAAVAAWPGATDLNLPLDTA